MEGGHIDKKGRLVSGCRGDQLGSRSARTGIGKGKIKVERRNLLDNWIVILTRDFAVHDVTLGASRLVQLLIIENLGG